MEHHRDSPIEGLRSLISRHTRDAREQTPTETLLPGVVLVRASDGRHPRHILHSPALCVVASGAKTTSFGNRDLHYADGQAMIVTTTIPGVSRIERASPTMPYLGMIIALEPLLLAEMATAVPFSPSAAADADDDHLAFVWDCDDPVMDCVLRLARLLDEPEAIDALQPVYARELSFRLLNGDAGPRLMRAMLDRHSHGIADALALARERYADPLPVAAMADAANLSVSAFHPRFKALTGLTPLGFQKRLRLIEARRLLGAGATAQTAAYRVGYQSASQFSRDYSKAFGAPPRRSAVDDLHASP